MEIDNTTSVLKVIDYVTNKTALHPNKLISADKGVNRILDVLLEGVQIIDFNWCYVYVNKAVVDCEQTTKENLQGHSFMRRYPGIERTEFFAELESSMLERKSTQVEIEYIYPDLSKKWFQLTIEPVKEGIMVLSLDISKRKGSDEKLRRLSQLYLFISQINQKIVRVKDEATLFRNACKMALEFGKFKLAWIGLLDGNNPGKIFMVEHCGILEEEIKQIGDTTLGFPFSPKNIAGSDTHYISTDIDRDPVMEAWRPYATKHGIQSCMVLPIKKSGRIIGTFNLYSANSDLSSKEEIALLVEATSDISFALDLFEKEKLLREHLLKRKRAEENLIQNNEELRKTNSELDRFVYSVSHDLRAPLSSVLGLISLIELGSKETDTLNYSNLIRKSINRLDDFIGNIIGYSKNNRLELEVTNVPLMTTIEEIVDYLRNSKEAEGTIFRINIDEQQQFYSDVRRFRIVIENLVSNAIKFQDHRRAERIITITGKTTKDNLHLEVIDNGIGIALEYQPKIFDMFFRISGERSGSGIGLYIVKETVDKLQGTISVHSNAEMGTTFSLQLKNLMA